MAIACSIVVGACADEKSHANDGASPNFGVKESGSVAEQPAVPADADTIVVTSKGGMGWASSRDPASNCWMNDSTFTLVRQARLLTWKTCQNSPGAASDGGNLTLSQFVDGQKTLTETEYAKLDEALQATTVKTSRNCVMDAPVLGITVTSPRGSVTYQACDEDCAEKPRAEGLLLVLHRLDALAGSESFPYLLVGFEDPAGP